MKIVFVSDAVYPYFTGGKEKRLYELSTRLAKMGHDVHIYTMHWWQTPEKVRTDTGVNLHALCKHHELYHGERRSIKEGVLFGCATLKLGFIKFDVLDVDHMPFFPVISAWVICVCTLRYRRFFATWHEVLSKKEWVSYMGTAGLLASVIEHVCMRLPCTIIAASQSTQEKLSGILGARKRVLLVPSGIDKKFIQASKPASKKCDVLAVGRLVKDKNMNMLLRSMAIVVKQDKKTSCIIVGKGPEKARLIHQCTKLGLNKNVTFIERLPLASDVYAYMKAAKVFCLPSIREGFGIVTLESLACGTPVVTTDSPANASRKLISEQRNGSVVPLNAEAIASAMQYWVHVKQTLRVTKDIWQYDWDVLSHRLAEIFAAHETN